MRRLLPATAVALCAVAGSLSLGIASAAPSANTPTPTSTSAGPAGADPSSLEKAVAYVGPSIVFYVQTWSGRVYDTLNKSYLNNGKPFEITSTCTGFVLSPNGYLASAGHCVDYTSDETQTFKEMAADWALKNGYFQDKTLTAQQILAFDIFAVKGPEGSDNPVLAVTAAWGTSDSQGYTTKPARVIDHQKFDEGDAALLKVEANDLNVLKVSSTGAPQVGDDVVAVGFPGKVMRATDLDLNSPSYKTGKVSSIKTIGNGLVSVYEIDAAVAPGMSGGPTVDSSGQVLGLNSFGAGDTEQFNFIAPSDRLIELMGSHGVSNVPSAISTKYRQGIDAYFAGHKSEAVADLVDVTRDQPWNTLAVNYLRKANSLADATQAAAPTPGVGSQPPWGWLAGGVGLVVLVAIGALIWLLMRRSSAPAPAAGPPPPPSAGSPLPGHRDMPAPSAETSGTRQQASAATACLSCGQSAGPQSRFCSNCGEQLPGR